MWRLTTLYLLRCISLMPLRWRGALMLLRVYIRGAARASVARIGCCNVQHETNVAALTRGFRCCINNMPLTTACQSRLDALTPHHLRVSSSSLKRATTRTAVALA